MLYIVRGLFCQTRDLKGLRKGKNIEKARRGIKFFRTGVELIDGAEDGVFISYEKKRLKI